MKILTVSFYRYYNGPRGIEPQFYYLHRVPEQMGHEVDFFDYQTAAAIGLPHMRRLLVSLLRGGGYDAVFLATHRDEFDLETLAEARKHAVTVAWNSDDEWRWEEYSSRYVGAYSFMVTNSPSVYAAQKGRHPNLLHAQWACTGFWDGRAVRKDIDFSFVGQVYGIRREQTDHLAGVAGLQTYGKGSGRIAPGPVTAGWKGAVRQRLRRWVPRIAPDLADDTLSFEEVNALWNRTRVSFTPLDSSTGGVRQIKSRVFDMGLSGTLMLAHRAPDLDRYYEPGKEYVPFETLEECADQARYYLRHEEERRRIAEAYARRTEAEHLWRHRIERVLKEAGLS